MKDKDIFDVQVLSKDAFAESLGLADVPELGADWEAGDEDLERNKMKKKKNQSALQRLKEKIRAKKQGKDKDAAREEEEEENELAQKDGAKKKLGKWERRQRRIAAAGKANAEESGPANEDDDFLQPVASPRELPVEVAKLPSGNKKLKLRKDGSAVQASGQHVFFSKDGTKKTSELGQLAEELRSEQFDPEGSDRASFLEQVSRDLALRDSSDAAVSRQRIHEKHQKKRRKERSKRGAKIEAGEAGEDGDEDDPPSRSPSPPKLKKAREAPERPRPQVFQDLGEDLGDLEKQALSKLGGLFS